MGVAAGTVVAVRWITAAKGTKEPMPHLDPWFSTGAFAKTGLVGLPRQG